MPNDTESIRGFKDTPITDLSQETLGLGEYADALSEFVLACDTPMTIALQGDWGSGKTSLMNLIRSQVVTANRNIKGVWFNTWQYSQFSQGDMLPLAMISQFISQIGGNEDNSALKKTINMLGKGLRFGAAMVATYATSDSGAVQTAKDAASGEATDSAAQLAKLKGQLEALVAKQSAQRIVVFVDDLDRLVPEKAVELLESLKLFLDLDRCVFLLACDYNVVVQGLKAKFAVGEADLKGKSFFDKIIQVPFNMPLTQYRVDTYFVDLLDRVGMSWEESDIPLYQHLVQFSTGFNPRGMKRIFNSLLLLRIVAKKKDVATTLSGAVDDNEFARILFAILCLQSAYPQFYEYLASNSDSFSVSMMDDLRNEEALAAGARFKEVRAELGEVRDRSYFPRLADFMEAFFQGIQLKADTDDTKNNKLSALEIRALQTILSFSAVVSTESAGRTSQRRKTQDEFRNDLSQQERDQFDGIFAYMRANDVDFLMGSKGFSIKNRHGKALIHCYPSSATRRSTVVTRDQSDTYKAKAKAFLRERKISGYAFRLGDEELDVPTLCQLVEVLREASEEAPGTS